MKRALFLPALFVLSGLAFGAGALAAAPHAKLPDKPLPGEVPFVQSIQKDLNARFATEEAAERAGYFRYTNEDKTGAISYANLQWNSIDPRHPSQLWYDVKGNLLGADFSKPLSVSPAAPVLWGVNPARWFKFRGPHVHYILKLPGGAMKYELAVGGKQFVAAGGNLNDPKASTLVKMGKVKSAAEVAKIFTFPAEWDLIVWVKDNPSGAFAEANPLVHPSAASRKGAM